MLIQIGKLINRTQAEVMSITKQFIAARIQLPVTENYSADINVVFTLLNVCQEQTVHPLFVTNCE